MDGFASLWLYRRYAARFTRSSRLLPEGVFDRALQAFRRVGNKLNIFKPGRRFLGLHRLTITPLAGHLESSHRPETRPQRVFLLSARLSRGRRGTGHIRGLTRRGGSPALRGGHTRWITPSCASKTYMCGPMTARGLGSRSTCASTGAPDPTSTTLTFANRGLASHG